MEIYQTAVGMLGTNCYLLVSGNEAAIVDPGADPARIERFVDGICGDAAKVRYILRRTGTSITSERCSRSGSITALGCASTLTTPTD